MDVDSLWIAFGVSKSLWYILAKDLATNFRIEIFRALLAFYAYTGCERTSSCSSIGKKTAWYTIQNISLALITLSRAPTEESPITNVPILE